MMRRSTGLAYSLPFPVVLSLFITLPWSVAVRSVLPGEAHPYASLPVW